MILNNEISVRFDVTSVTSKMFLSFNYRSIVFTFQCKIIHLYTASLLMYLEIDYILLQMNQQCKVCGEPAAGFHFGAFTCEGCKVSLTV